jgi:hypothetical protein
VCVNSSEVVPGLPSFNSEEKQADSTPLVLFVVIKGDDSSARLTLLQDVALQSPALKQAYVVTLSGEEGPEKSGGQTSSDAYNHPNQNPNASNTGLITVDSYSPNDPVMFADINSGYATPGNMNANYPYASDKSEAVLASSCRKVVNRVGLRTLPTFPGDVLIDLTDEGQFKENADLCCCLFDFLKNAVHIM